jgi:cell division protein ZapE
MQQGPLDCYRRLTARGEFSPDPDQLQAAQALQDVWAELRRQRDPGRLVRALRGAPLPVRGLYLWGGVGRGKTWLMDLFYEQLPLQRKRRIHFHRFMQRIHDGLRARANVRDPLTAVANEWSETCRVLCLDEFFVADIADAMLLAGLLENLFAKGVTLVTTSNTAPGDLYQDGLQRSKFLPAIALLERHTRVLQLCGTTDHRLRILEQSKIYHHPGDAAAERALTSSFDRIAAACELDHELDINGRAFHARRRGDGIIWFHFDELCSKPRGSRDYSEIARAFNTVVISGAPQLREEHADAARRFITMVDEFYDRNVKLLMSAATPIDRLYTGSKLAFDFARTASRLVEMQSHEYLARPHLP